MTAPNGPILFNSSSGSDSQASGLGPSTAVFGSTGSSTTSSAVVTGIDTTGVSAGDLFYGATSSGRKFSIIASVDSGTQVTLDDVLSATHSGNLTWAIGGKRASLAGSSRLIDDGSTGDIKAGWIVELGDGYTETLSATIRTRISGDTTNGPITLRGESGSSVKPVLTFSNNGRSFWCVASYWTFRDFNLVSSGSGTSRWGLVTDTGTDREFRNIKVSNYYYGFYILSCPTKIISCEADSCEIGMKKGTGTGTLLVDLCRIHDCNSHGIEFTSNVLSVSIHRTISHDNGGDGINAMSFNNYTGSTLIANNISYNNTGDGIAIPSDVGSLENLVVEENIVVSNGAYGISLPASAVKLNAYNAIIERNAHYNNTSGFVDVSGVDVDSIALSADPFVDAAGGDFNINDAAGGGAVLRAATVTMP